MKQLGLYLLVLFSTNVFSQSTGKDSFSIIEDLNNDGHFDSLVLETSNGIVQAVNVYSSISKQQFHILGRGYYNHGSKARFLEIIPLPDDLLSRENKNLLDTITHYLLPAFKKPDASLDFLIAAYQSQELDTVGSFFTSTFSVNPNWENDPFIFPAASYRLISKDTLAVFWERICREEYLDYKHGLLVYYGHNHQPNEMQLQFETRTASFKINVTSHGVYISKGKKYSWLFVSDQGLTGGPNKLRWPSIKKINLYKNLLIIHQLCGLGNCNNVYVVNINTGKTGQLRIPEEYFSRNKPNCFDFEIRQSELMLYSKINENCLRETGTVEKISFELDLIKQGLE